MRTAVRCGIIILLLGSMASVGKAQSEAEIVKDQSKAQRAIETGDLSQALIATSSALYAWKDHPGWLDLSKALICAYGCLPASKVRSQYESMMSDLSGGYFGMGWLEAGIMAHAADDYVSAASCYEKIRFNGSLAKNPYPRALLGKALLAQGRVADATQAYESAIKSASNDQAGAFRIRYEYAQDLLWGNHVKEAVERCIVSQQSPYALERMWAEEELLLYHWGLGDATMSSVYAGELGSELEKAPARDDVPFEGRRIHTARLMRERFQKAMAGDAPSRMSLDEESTVYEFRQGEFERMIGKLQGWAKAYPLDQYATWSEELKRSALWTHHNLHCAECMSGKRALAAAGFEELLARISPEESPDMMVNAWCWRGYALMQTRDGLAEAARSFELGLTLDAMLSNAGLPSDYFQSRIAGGRTPSELRAAYVANYKWALNAMKNHPSGGEGR